ncbi:hypothetical protein LOTGIDRAFT_155357 [Lottia gigantea]|uniref:Endonuclease/exonuclease/phosphatase domain-containing protein n=1 Tax=Lottia gigantea TaxID=225164 RepID=V3Z0N1_LOTGI|nr:hypothetical protein LOTGIDRAFT_155357 [Lottia gigantea]ESO84043.1 hypothetical protein LOTGIDRAFT_155357 [Lottia gigantea]
MYYVSNTIGEGSEEEEEELSVSVDSRGFPGWDKVEALALALIQLKGISITAAETNNIKQLFDVLLDFDRRPIKYTAKVKKPSKGRFARSKGVFFGVDAVKRFIQLNINGLNVPERKTQLVQLLQRKQYDAVFLQESKLGSRNKDPIINGYTLIRLNRPNALNHRSGGGLAIYIKNGISHSEVPLKTIAPLEARRYPLPKSQRFFSIVNIYRPEVKGKPQRFSEYQSEVISEIRRMIHNYQTNNDQKIELVWVPSHVSIPGNDQADRCAKESLSLEEIEPVEYSYSEFCSIVSSRINQKWSDMLRNLDTARYQIDPKIPNQTKPNQTKPNQTKPSICSHLQSGNQTPDQQRITRPSVQCH